MVGKRAHLMEGEKDRMGGQRRWVLRAKDGRYAASNINEYAESIEGAARFWDRDGAEKAAQIRAHGDGRERRALSLLTICEVTLVTVQAEWQEVDEAFAAGSAP